MLLLDLNDGIKSIASVSGTFVTWSLTIVGASVLAIVSTSYFRPGNKIVRFVYFLFIPGWICLLISMYFGNLISRRLAASFFTNDKSVLMAIGSKMNTEFGCQIGLFKAGLACFTLWLIAYLCWWVLTEVETKKTIY